MTGLETLGTIVLAASAALSGVQSKDAMLNFKHATVGVSVSTVAAPAGTVLTAMAAVASPVRGGGTSFASAGNWSLVADVLRVVPSQSRSQHLRRKGFTDPSAVNRLPFLPEHLAFAARGGQPLAATLADHRVQVPSAFGSIGPQTSPADARTWTGQAFLSFRPSLVLVRPQFRSRLFCASPLVHAVAGSGTIDGVRFLAPYGQLGPEAATHQAAILLPQEFALTLPQDPMPPKYSSAEPDATRLIISPAAFACPHNS